MTAGRQDAAERDDTAERLRAWFSSQVAGATDLRLEGLDRLDLGHSAEMLAVTLAWHADGDDHRRDVVVRLRPPAPGLLEPYDLPRQFTILRALEPTPVRAPRALWLEPTGDVLGRPFFVMERVAGEAYETHVPAEIDADPVRIRRMSESLVEQLAAIHLVDWQRAGLASLGGGADYVDTELAHWEAEMRRVQRGPLPAMERLLAELRARQPAANPIVTLVHGDAKPGNYGFVGSEVSAVFDWEMAGIGDPFADIGYLELLWGLSSFTGRPAALTCDEFVDYYESVTGHRVTDRPWYRAFQAFKLSSIMLIAAMLFDSGRSDDLRFCDMGYAVPVFTERGLKELGIQEQLDPGPVTARPERIRQVREGTAAPG